MKKLAIYILIPLLITIFSCREIYYPEDLDWNERIPVIQGVIMEGQSPVIRMYWAVDYEHDSMRYITGATVIVSDDIGTTDSCYGSWTGSYFGSHSGIPGRTYTLKVVLDDGREFISIPQLLQPAPHIDSIYCIPGKHSEYVYGSSGKPVYTHMQGLFLHTDVSNNYPGTLYYRFNTTLVKLSNYTVDLNSPSSYSVYVWETTTMDNTYTVDRSVTVDNRQILSGHPVGFLRYYYDPSLQSSTRTAPYTDAWVVKQNVYSISSDAFQYYNSVGSLLGGNNRIFAPVSSQVRSNVFCVSDPKEKVIGIFEASSMSSIYRAFGWKGLNSYRVKDLDSYPDVGTGSQDRFPPYFWIYFY
jgi:hypothetical protein